MKKCLSFIFLFFLFCATFILPCEAISTTYVTQNTASLNYITQSNCEITLVQGEENYYVVEQNKLNTKITGTNKNGGDSLIFGEDAITEDNILQHYVISKEKLEKNRKHHKLSPTLKNSVYTRAP